MNSPFPPPRSPATIMSMQPLKRSTLSIVTVNFKSADRINALAESLEAFPPDIPWEWIIVDNNSGTQEIKKIQSLIQGKSNLHLIKLSENVGFGKGNAEGVQFAHGEILAFLNPDTEVQKNTFQPLLEAVAGANVGIVTPQLTTPEGAPLQNTWDFPTWGELIGRRLFRKKYVPPSNNSPRTVDWAQGSFLVMKKKLFEDLGGFDDRFFLFFEDTDLCRRVHEAGFQVLQIPESHAHHGSKRLSGTGLFPALWKRTFWMHVWSAVKYFSKWRSK